MRRLLLGLGLAVALTGGVAAASALTSEEPPRLPTPGAFEAVVGSVQFDAREPDPDGGPPWTVRVYTGKTGLSCVEVGRIDGARFGPLDGAGRVVDTPVRESGACGDLQSDKAQLAAVQHAARPGQGARTIVFGRAADDVARLRLVGPGLDRAWTPAGARTFLVVAAGLLDPGAYTLTVTLNDGQSRDQRLK